ncbi:deoxyribodipyrimidine photolyase-related protein [Cyclobacterium lianum]|uniref:Deoxyribodipyrimidine photolyase-related protein n=1 Tax=Cyclobacterium lianum TaxID=388280 RepID=A0A1M7K0A5_9BACT|nr:cryptochrome/photolyase family protein [Cyclobacterium lianum]SHM58706.1 deoxyribodipyrimidine photolyase-related protein [Cyclobacterium lianum]
MEKTLRLILGDQLNRQHSWFKKKQDAAVYLMMELRQETDYVQHHIQKVLAFFQSMRLFAQWLEKEGHKVIYLSIEQKENRQELEQNIRYLIKREDFKQFNYILPDEYRLDRQIRNICKQLEIETKSFDAEHFLSDRLAVKSFFSGKKTFLMELFYHSMREKYDILMDGNKPAGGKWNFDQENRNKFDEKIMVPSAPVFNRDLSDLLHTIRKAGIKTIGEVDPKNFQWPCCREEALELLAHFCDNLLPHFGRYQDAMHSQHPFLFHSKLSFALNSKMLHPLEVIRKAAACREKNPDKYGIAQVEGFIRQILGWREFMRGVYWAKMPDFATMNFFGHKRPLPAFFWDGKTKMNCLHHAIKQSLDHAYAHHIQRLMVTGNFALLAGLDPDEVDQWYLGIYVDAIEWVEITNTRGMSQFADGGIVGTKPYVSSANYIDKMSNYCGDCHYAKTKKTGDKACPFNSLYWSFYERNRDKLENNPRIGFVYNTLSKMKQKDEILEQAERYLKDLDEL